MQPEAIKNLVVNAVEELKGTHLRVLDVHKLTDITDYMVIATGRSRRQVIAIAEEIVAQAKHAGHAPLGVEGMDAGEWVLVDLNDVVCHVMQAETREFYQLEKLWDIDEVIAPAKVLGNA